MTRGLDQGAIKPRGGLRHSGWWLGCKPSAMSVVREASVGVRIDSSDHRLNSKARWINRQWSVEA
ncbi:MAG: hypothetical protein ACREIG_04080, partial [Nitrospiraceae bacterium]